MSALPLESPKLVTSRLFESYLACATKCYLQSIGEVATENDFAIWNETRSKSYCLAGIQRLKWRGRRLPKRQIGNSLRRGLGKGSSAVGSDNDLPVGLLDIAGLNQGNE
jgi:hypothetical protein